MKELLETEKFIQVGGRLCLDFINTKISLNEKPFDLLADLPDLAAWAAKSKLITIPEAEKLAQRFAAEKEAEKILEQIREFREILREAVFNLERGERISSTAIEKINARLSQKSGFAEIVENDEGGYEKRFRAEYSAPLDLLAPIAESAADLICYANSQRVKKCENPACVLHFYDTTRNHSRRWCSMQICGNRAKAAKYYQKKKGKK